MEVIQWGRWNIHGILYNYHWDKHCPRQIRHITKLLSQKNEQSSACLYLHLILLYSSGLFLHFRPNCCPHRCDCPSSIPSIYHLHRKSPSDSPHSTSHRTSFTGNLAVAIFKFAQIKSTKVVRLKMPKNSVYKLKAPLKWRSEIAVFPRIPFRFGLVVKQLKIYLRWLPRSKSYKFVWLGVKGLTN